uniref:Uncharacterized protein n=1 Tax=viral metagenome TaxID=1070528 RepID=A0A6M3JTF2_9ZZZZ
MTPKQLWYICKIYPEPISAEEAQDAFEDSYKNKDYEEKQADASYWEAALKIIKETEDKS